MSLRRAPTRRLQAGASGRAKGLEDVQQGLQVIYPDGNDDSKSDIDVVFVPGLAAHPVTSWQSTRTKWNWMTSADGLRSTFPRARILLYMYESAWQGQLKVKNQFMHNISKTLLVALRSRRENCKKRPIVFIGHSMGGLVIAKAITILNAQPELCPVMFEAISAAVFFGTPFAGAPVAAWASMYAYCAEKWNKATTSELLDMLRPGDAALQELKDEFRRVAAKTQYKIELLCFWEEQDTDFTQMANLPGLFGLAKHLIPQKLSEFVSRASATFEGDVPKYGLASNHRDLVKFDSAKDARWNIVENLLGRMMNEAYRTAKSRLSAARDVDRDTIRGVMEALDSFRVHPSRLRRGLMKSAGKSSLISQEADYKEWINNIKSERNPIDASKVDGLWVRGPEGRGKTGAMLTALDDVENLLTLQENGETILSASFLCDAGTDYCTAEDCLKSVIWQLIDQEKALITYATDFIKKKVKNGNVASRATPTVENLWKALIGMLTDEYASSRVYIILSNLHRLPEDSDSTLKFLNLLSLELRGSQMMDPSRVMVKWLITSRPTYAIQEALRLDRLRVIDLEDNKFDNQFHKTLQIHAKIKVDELQATKKYNKPLAWFARSLIGERAQNTSWIDITCLQLEELPEAESDLRVRAMLEATPQELNTLLNSVWVQIFRSAEEHGENVREMLRALILTTEEPTEAELAVLCGLDGSDHDKHQLRTSIEKCKPLVSVKRTISFMNTVVKQHLLDNVQDLLGLSPQETARQHGLLSLRSLSYLKDKLNFAEKATPPVMESVGDEMEDSHNDAAASVGSRDDDDSTTETEPADWDSEYDGSSLDEYDDWSEDDWDDDSEPDLDPEAEILERKAALPYMVKNWLQHGSRATTGFADDLSLDEEFWKSGSLLRRRWLVEYSRHTREFEYEDIRGMNALHIVAAIGFRQLLTALADNGHKDEIDGCDGNNATPFDKADMVEELLDRGADVNAGEKDKEDTPLHIAAKMGHVKVMRKLIARGAKLDTFSENSGLVLNSAISSGNLATIELLVSHGVKLSNNGDDVEAPLAQAAYLCDVPMMEYLMIEYAPQLAPEDYSKALTSAAEAGSLEVLNKLLPFDHSDHDYQYALDVAAEEGNWEITKVLLENRKGLSCDKVFYEAATRTDDLEVLEALWEYTNGSISAETLDQSLYQTVDDKKPRTVGLLLEKFGADPNAQGDEYGNALTASAYDGTLDILKLLLDHGASIDSADGWPLQTAATEGHIDIVRELLLRGANVNAKTDNPNFPQQTALQGACELGNDRIVDILLQHDADPNLGGGEDDYPIIGAANNCNIDIISKLVLARADVNVVGGNDGDTALIVVAKRIASLKPVEQLLKAGARIDATNHNGDTALIAAAYTDDDELVNFLLAKGADVMHTNNDGKNAMQVASESGSNFEDTAKVLIKHVSTILSGIKSRVEAGDQAFVDVVHQARAVARRANENDRPRLESDQENDTGTPVLKGEWESGQTEGVDSDFEGNFEEGRAESPDERLPPVNQPYLNQVAFSSDTGTQEEIGSAMPRQTLAHDIHYSGMGNEHAYLYPNSPKPPSSTNKVGEFSLPRPAQQDGMWQRQGEITYSNSPLAAQDTARRSDEVSQAYGVPLDTNRMAPVKRKPAPIPYGAQHPSQDSVAYNSEPQNNQQWSPDNRQPTNFVAYDPSNNHPGPYLPPREYPTPSATQNWSPPPHYNSEYAPQPPPRPTPPSLNSYSRESSPSVAPRPPPVQAYSSPAQMQQQQQQTYPMDNRYHAMPPPLPQGSRPSFFDVKNTFTQAKGRLFSSNRGGGEGYDER